ncbi:hypothetical protein F5Y18DRAFT_428737 [Xylariaceae sp. FL1019]|nr:hypothetical protein F5Y18DRAFT_428737 [Xylariaceae sp. FL1019]
MKLFGFVLYAWANSALTAASPAALTSASSDETPAASISYPGLDMHASACNPKKCLACITGCAREFGTTKLQRDDDHEYRNIDDCVEHECLPKLCVGCHEEE